ncbi:MAG: hypothetical protein ACE5JN_16310 [Candidatus Methylomirabilia bacterium]
MERLKPKDLLLVRRLLDLDKPHFGVADLEKVLGQRRPSLYVALHRLVAYGVLVRLSRGVYQVALKQPDLARIANALVYPSYLSFESALSRYGILSQVPYALSFATPRRSRRLTLGDTLVEYHQLKGPLFFGYTLANGLNLAEPEKALLDQLYLIARGGASLTLQDLDLSRLDRTRLRAYAPAFPPSVQATAQRLVERRHRFHARRSST